MGRKTKWFIRIAPIVLGALIIVTFYVENKEEVVTISGETLANQYMEDEATADKQFSGTIVNVTGEVTEIQPGDLITLFLKGNEMSQIQCVLKAGANLSPTISVGDTVTLQGACVGILMDVIIRDCILVTN